MADKDKEKQYKYRQEIQQVCAVLLFYLILLTSNKKEGGKKELFHWQVSWYGEAMLQEGSTAHVGVVCLKFNATACVWGIGQATPASDRRLRLTSVGTPSSPIQHAISALR
jgi:hypothetical protein